MAGPSFAIDFPTLHVGADWIMAHCVVPDGFHKDEPFELVDWQAWCLLNHYRVKEEAVWNPDSPVLGSAFYYRRSQIVMPQKAGKNPLIAAQVCLEAVGPALFGGWAAGGETWDCRDHGCGCGWAYPYEPGEPMGMPWPTPLIQITAFSEEQTGNTYDALKPMIDNGPLSEVIPKTGEEFIRLPRGGRIDVVTSSHRSRLGQRVTFVPQDQTESWTAQTGMIKVAETQRRGLAGMGGRAVEIANAWDPAENSVAQRTAESKSKDVFRYHPMPPAKLRYAVKKERDRIHQIVYAGSWWTDLAGIEAEAKELLEFDPAQAERFFGNRPTPGAGAAFDIDRWKELVDASAVVADKSVVVLGVDGARYDDALAVVATEVESGHQWVVGIWEQPENAPDDYEHPFDDVDIQMLGFFERFEVWRVYIDPGSHSGNISPLVERWQGRWGDKRIIEWFTYRERQIGFAVRNYVEAINGGDLTHDGDMVMAKHIRNARKKLLKVTDEHGRQMWTIQKDRPGSPNKIDGAMGGVLSWEARGDAIAAGATKTRSNRAVFL
jgi:hypothetical protein